MWNLFFFFFFVSSRLCDRAFDSCSSRKSNCRKGLRDPTASIQSLKCWSRPSLTAWSILYTYTGLSISGEVTVLHTHRTHTDTWFCLILTAVDVCRYKQSHLVTARASVTVMHPELGCLISCVQLQEFSIILLYAEEGQSPGITFFFKLYTVAKIKRPLHIVI